MIPSLSNFSFRVDLSFRTASSILFFHSSSIPCSAALVPFSIFSLAPSGVPPDSMAFSFPSSSDVACFSLLSCSLFCSVTVADPSPSLSSPAPSIFSVSAVSVWSVCSCPSAGSDVSSGLPSVSPFCLYYIEKKGSFQKLKVRF